MRVYIVPLHVILYLLLPALSARSPVQSRTVYLLDDAVHHQWCLFASELPWRSAVRAASATRVATAEYDQEHVISLNVTEEDGAGDWTVYDRYSLDRSGKLQMLRRTINVLPGERSVEQLYSIRSGKVVLVHRTVRDLSTGRPASLSGTWLPKLPITTKLAPFPFYSLLNRGPLGPGSTGPACVHTPPA